MNTYRNFKSYEELCESLLYGADIEFEYNNKKYSITPIENGVSILEQYNYSTEIIYNNINDVGNYIIANKYLKDIIGDIKILFRTI